MGAFIGVVGFVGVILAAIGLVKGGWLWMKDRKQASGTLLIAFILLAAGVAMDPPSDEPTKTTSTPSAASVAREERRAREAAAKADEALKKAMESLDEWDDVKAAEHIATIETNRPDEPQLPKLRERLSEVQAVVAEIGPKPKNSAWDGAVQPVTAFLKQYLKDPDSVQYDEWSPVFLQEIGGEKYWVVRSRYRAKNSFGAYVIEEKLFFMQHNTVVDAIDY